MDLNINSPAYFKKHHGIDEAIYWMCRDLAAYVKDKRYSKFVNIVGIVPIIAPEYELCQGKYKEVKKCEKMHGFASVSLQIDYDAYLNADIELRKRMMLENVIKSVKVICKRAEIDFERFEGDVRTFCKEHNISDL